MKGNVHSIKVDTKDRDSLVREVILWGEASWWPAGSLMRFERLTTGDIRPGTRYLQKVMFPFAPKWHAEVTEVRDSGIWRRFSDGMFEGHEQVTVRPSGEGFCVDYFMRYEVRGAVNKLLWPLAFRRMHDGNIELILRNLKDFMEKKA